MSHSHVMIIALPISCEKISEQSFLFQNYVYKNFATASYDELVTNEMLKANVSNTIVSESQIRERFPSILSFQNENVQTVMQFCDDILIDKYSMITLFEYLDSHSFYPLFTNGHTSFYKTILIKILDFLKTDTVQFSKSCINCLLHSANKFFNTTDDAIKTLIQKHYEVDNDDFFKKWRLYFVYRNSLVTIKEVNSTRGYLHYFPEMKNFFDDIPFLEYSNTEEPDFDVTI